MIRTVIAFQTTKWGMLFVQMDSYAITQIVQEKCMERR